MCFGRVLRCFQKYSAWHLCYRRCWKKHSEEDGEGGGCSPVGRGGVCKSPAGLGEHPVSPPRLTNSKGSFVTDFTRARVPFHMLGNGEKVPASAHLGPYCIPFLSSPHSLMISKNKKKSKWEKQEVKCISLGRTQNRPSQSREPRKPGLLLASVSKSLQKALTFREARHCIHILRYIIRYDNTLQAKRSLETAGFHAGSLPQ